ncbi:hypothetical protein M427DRAFT_176181 [Gonapodya prolifera JEL478]|uniref:N-acetyltransferase domain-containing protein n=1 Tax=Gonapodya prolifera (strain JEL478) TaxID=1344416 RepID=A0A139AQN3_GONPJ|nr:hypothetical protein M427DRAFT_176181 [Gonapodya prolifera JEL478]|eukprot:KXS18795.1 hypothetical protein M427DRAFT_176181 [Gonapodya prolifera JEL478]
MASGGERRRRKETGKYCGILSLKGLFPNTAQITMGPILITPPQPLPPSYPARDSRVSFLSDAGHLSVLHDWHLQFIKETGVPAPPDPFAMFDKLLKDPGIRKAVLFTEDGTPMSMAFHRKVAHPLVPRIGMVYTPPEFRNRGASTRLMSSLVREILEEDGVSATMLMADPHASAWRVYEKVGFTKCGDFSMFQIG